MNVVRAAGSIILMLIALWVLLAVVRYAAHTGQFGK